MDWLSTALSCQQQGLAAVLVTVAQVQGSAPRSAGTHMLVTASQTIDTIGGGHLEWQAITQARAMLASASPKRQLTRWSLAASLGQCCGGVVWLCFECLDASDQAWLQAADHARQQRQSLRRRVPLSREAAISYQTLTEAATTQLDAQQSYLQDDLAAPSRCVIVCGAGHIGLAIVELLADLPFHVICLDPREERLPQARAANITLCHGDENDVPQLPAHADWLVLTHSHSLDFALVRAILQRQDARFLGMIGSNSKRASFQARLSPYCSAEQIAQLQCPIGLAGIESKHPKAIAVAVVAELLLRR